MGTDQAKALASILKEHPTLKSLCGNRGDETELNMRGKMKGAADAIMLVSEIIDNGAMTKFDISSNGIRAEGGKALAEGLKGNQVIKELIFSDNDLGYNSNADTDTSGIIAIADVIPGMGAMTALNLSRNFIGLEGAKHIAEGIKVSKYVVAVVLAPFSSPSGHWFNCCCLLLSTG
jgi:Ran GTPase-activating protein (RanGAP) involved in mRNA processing and transport